MHPKPRAPPLSVRCRSLWVCRQSSPASLLWNLSNYGSFLVKWIVVDSHHIWRGWDVQMEQISANILWKGDTSGGAVMWDQGLVGSSFGHYLVLETSLGWEYKLISGDKTTLLTKFRVATLLCLDHHLVAILDEKESRNGNIWVISRVNVNIWVRKRGNCNIWVISRVSGNFGWEREGTAILGNTKGLLAILLEIPSWL